MKKRIVWLLVSCLMVAALLLASCGPAAEEEEVVIPEEEEEEVVEEEVVAEEKEMVKVTLEKLDGTVVEKWLEKPKYGGVGVSSLSADVLGFDESYTAPYQTWTMNFTNECLVEGDWSRGPAGTSEASWRQAGLNLLSLSTGRVAESWEVPDDETIIYHIRKGTRFHDKPPVNGREVNADDVVFSLKRQFEDTSAYCYSTYTAAGNAPTSITAPDKWTVVVKVPPENLGALLIVTSGYISIVAPEMLEAWGGDMKDWEASCGTGPFMLVDYVKDSTMTFERNPDYWMKDPLFPENSLPYRDGHKILVLPDASTRIAAMRTGKLDSLGLNWEDWEDIMETNPMLNWTSYLGSTSFVIYMRLDKPELPFGDIRIRRALNMAIDRQAIKEDYYGGNAEIFHYPIVPVLDFMDMYTPLEELPESVRERYEYQPDKAKQLLAEAGYPDGFKTSVICSSTASAVDLLSIVQDNWAKIGVELELQPKDIPVWSSTVLGKRHKEMCYFYTGTSAPFKMNDFKPKNPQNNSMVDDQLCIDTYAEVCLYYPVQETKAREILKEISQYIAEQAWVVDLPLSYSYVVWWPWVKGFQGESSVGYYAAGNQVSFIWLDQELKKEMGY